MCGKKKIASLQARLEVLECSRGTSAIMEEIDHSRVEINKLREKEKIMWRQRSCISWLKQGDKNTSFFHIKASSKFKRNTIQVCGMVRGAGRVRRRGLAEPLRNTM